VLADNKGDDFDHTSEAELRLPGRHAFGEIWRTFADDAKNLQRIAAVFPFGIVERLARELGTRKHG